ncbi:uncharacterized protein LOC125504057, partial [Dendroctonus ponderosae]|uniref:uncharacterized protein LOC125504057 n=1 Tax=Dendroctonus ponderosae TaxID=77166 RepID=UPI002035AE08
MKRCFRTNQAKNIYNRAERALLRERIHETRRDLAYIDSRLLPVNIELANKMHWIHWEKVDRLTADRMMVTEAAATNRQKKKFDALMEKLQQSSKTGPSPEENQRKIVVNLTSKELTADEQSVLAKGGNFAIVPSRLPVEDIISN